MRPKNTDRKTPRTDALLHELRAAFDGRRGAQSDCARHLAGSDDPARVRDGVSQFRRWFTRQTIPDGEHLLTVMEWLAQEKAHGRAKRRRAMPS